MGWTVVERCRDDNCPRLLVDDETAQVYVQGAVVTTPGPPVPGEGEGLVRMSTDEFEELLELYTRRK